MSNNKAQQVERIQASIKSEEDYLRYEEYVLRNGGI